MDKFSELKDALEFLEATEFDGEWDSALVGGENGKNYHAVINANDVVVRSADDSRHTSWLCDYLEAVSPVKIRALLADLEAKDKRIADMEAKTSMTMGVGDGSGSLFVHGDYDSIRAAQRIVLENEELRAKLATPVRLKKVDSSNVPFAGDGFNAAVDYCAKAVRAAGFTVEGDE
uniref:hypothetical protein n=1 Tax=Serratia quinivorans TaxID=137545 RepID=UPI0035C72508